MRFRAGKDLLACCLSFVSLVAMALGSAEGQATDPLKRELIWSQPENEIADVQFSRDGNFIVLASRVHWPDGDEAEGLPEYFFKKLEQRKRKNPRFADPVVSLIDLKGKVVCEVRHGTHPSVSPDNKSIVFSRQKRPISGLRPLAATLAGNDIQIFDCEKKEMRTIAQPTEGYLDTPFFLPNGKSIAYTRNEAVNGAMAGPVSLVQADLVEVRETVLFAKADTPSVPCPPVGSAKSDFQALLCAQPTKPSASFPDLIFGFAQQDDQLLVLTGKPLPAPGDVYLAKDYDINLISVFPKRNDLLSIGKADMGSLWNISLQPLSGERAMIFLEYWKLFSVQTKSWLPDAGPRNTNRRSIYSPDMRYYLAAEPAEEPDHFSLFRLADGKRLVTLPKMANVYEATWSRDSKRLAIVVVPRGASGSLYKEDLMVFSMP